MRKYTLFAVLLSLMVGSIAIIDARSTNYKPASEAPSLGEKIYAIGFVEGATQDIELRAESSGRIVQILVDSGEWVESGDVLIQLDDARQRQQIAVRLANLQLAEAQLERLRNGARREERAEARALLEAKKARLQQAVLTWRRIEELLHQQAISQQEADDQQGLVDTLTAEVHAAESRVELLEADARADEVRVAQAKVAAAKAELELARIALEKTQLTAPVRGQVLDVNVDEGEFILPNSASPVVILSDTSRLKVRAFVEEVDAPRVTVGMQASVTADGIPDSSFSGTVIAATPRMKQKTLYSGRPDELYDTKAREVVLTLENSEGLIVGLRVDVTFALARSN